MSGSSDDGSRAKHWFGLQLEVTQKLLAAEDRKLEAVEDDLEAGGAANLTGLRRLANNRLRLQYGQLNKEYDDAVAGLLRGGDTHARSLPMLGLKGASKQRSSVFSSLNIPKKPSVRRKAERQGSVRQVGDNITEIGVVEPEEDSDLTFKDGHLVSGTLEALIRHFLPTAEHMPDKLFIFTFLATSRLFLPPHALLSKTLDFARKVVPAQAAPDEDSLHSTAGRYTRLLQEWTETFSYDFRDERMMVHFRELTKLCAGHGPAIKTLIVDMQRTLFKKLNSLEQFEDKLRRELEIQQKSRNDTLSSGKSRPDTTLLDLTSSAAEVASQLKIIELERLCAIGPEEFIQTFVRGTEKSDYSDMREAHNLEAYVEWFNRLSYLVAAEIVRHDSKKARIKALEFFIQVGHECHLQHNFNSLMAIISALNFASIARLKKTWDKLPSKNHQLYLQLESTLDPSGNFRNYREEMSSLMHSSDVVPFFSLMVKDVYFTKEAGGGKRLANGHINFESMWRLTDRLADFMVYKSSRAQLERKDDIIRYLKTVPVWSEYELFKMSLGAEPPSKADQTRTLNRLKRLEAESGSESSAAASTVASPIKPDAGDKAELPTSSF